MSATPGPPPPEALALLLRRVAESRDRAAYALLFGHFAPRVKAYMRKLGAADAQAEDLAQDALLAVWHKAASFDPARAGAATWVFTIARNLRIDALRRLPKGGMADADSLPEPAYDAPGADAVLDTETRDGRLRAALQTLPAEQAKLVNLAYYEDRPHAEIERRLGIPLGTVKSRLRLAMRRLRAAMEDWP